MGWGPSVYMWGTALLFAAMAIAAATARGAHESEASRTRAAVVLATFAALAALAGIGIRRTRLTVDETGIELVEFGKPRRLRLEQIRGYRLLRVQAGTFVVFEPRLADIKKFRVPHIWTDDAFLSWLAQVPDLGAAEV